MSPGSRQTCRSLTDTIEFDLIRQMLGEEGTNPWRVEQIIDSPVREGSAIWQLTAKPEPGRLLAAEVEVGLRGVRPNRNPMPREIGGQTANWIGRGKLLWEGQPEDAFTQTISGRAQEQLKEGQKQLTQLNSALEAQGFGEVSPKPGSPIMPARRHRIFPSGDPEDQSRAAAFFEALRVNFRGFDGPQRESLQNQPRDNPMPSPLSVDILDLPFYCDGGRGIRGACLVELTSRRRDRPRRAQYVWCTNYEEGRSEPEQTLLLRQLDGTSAVIEGLNQFLDVRLSLDQAPDYLRFASSSLHGDEQSVERSPEYPPFRIIENLNELNWYPETHEVKRILGEYMAPIRVKEPARPNDLSEPIVAGAFVFYSGMLFFSVFTIHRRLKEGISPILLEMKQDFQLFPNLPARPVIDSVRNCFLLQPRTQVSP